MIALERIHVQFANPDGSLTAVLSDLSLQLQPGEFALVTGPNGSGKSTLLNVIAGTQRPTSGSVLIQGTDVTNQSVTQRSRLVARVFQNPVMSTAACLTVAENLRIADLRTARRTLRTAITAKDAERYRSALSACELGLEDRLDRITGTLSGGQRQALAVVMAALHPPAVLLLDEHTAALAPAAADKVMEITERLVRQHQISTLMVTHNREHFENFGDRMITLS
jgi:putative ABC transport system ATP-binding protein